MTEGTAMKQHHMVAEALLEVGFAPLPVIKQTLKARFGEEAARAITDSYIRKITGYFKKDITAYASDKGGLDNLVRLCSHLIWQQQQTSNSS